MVRPVFTGLTAFREEWGTRCLNGPLTGEAAYTGRVLASKVRGCLSRPCAEPEGMLGMGTSWGTFPSLNEGIRGQGVTQAINVLCLFFLDIKTLQVFFRPMLKTCASFSFMLAGPVATLNSEEESDPPTYKDAFPPLPEKSACLENAQEPAGAWGNKIRPIKASVITQVETLFFLYLVLQVGII